jgi:OFA family oxalate/formate antiporter-like MFS transporter
MEVNQVERWLRLTFSAVVLLFAGIIYAWAILRVPFAQEFGWDAGQLSMNYTLTIVAFSICGFLAGLLAKSVAPRWRILAAAVLLFTGFFLTSRLSGESILMLYLAYGVMSGAGVGFAYTSIIGLTNAWFPDKRGLCSGIVMMSFGLKSLIIGNVADVMIKTDAIGWRTTFLILAIAEGVILGIAAFAMKAPPEGTIFPAAKAAKKPDAKAAKPEPAKDYTLSEVIRRPSFWMLFCFLILLASVGSAAIALAGDILKELKVESPAGLIGILAIFNGLGRLTAGFLYDNLGLRKTQYVMSGIAISGPATVMLAVSTGSLVVGVIGLSLCFFSYGFAPTTSSVFASSFYGMKNFTQNFSILNLILIPAPFAAVMAGTIFVSTGSFFVPFGILTGCSVVGLLINLMIKKA